jgi:hypothetical protein
LQADGWTGTNTRQIAMGPNQTTLTDVVDVYLSSFGRVVMDYNIYLSKTYSPNDDYERCYLLDKSKWSLLSYIETYSKETPSNGLYKSGVIVTALSLRCLQEAANGRFTCSN